MAMTISLIFRWLTRPLPGVLAVLEPRVQPLWPAERDPEDLALLDDLERVVIHGLALHKET